MSFMGARPGSGLIQQGPEQPLNGRPVMHVYGTPGRQQQQQPAQPQPQAQAPQAQAHPAAANPLQPTYMPTAPTVNATMGQAAQSNAPTQLNQGLVNSLGPQATIQQIMQGFAPQAAQSTAALNNTLAAMGIVGGGAQDAQTMLQGQLASSLAPTLANAIQNSQGNQLNAGEFGVNNGLQQSMNNAGMQQQQTLANQSASNQANLYNGTNDFNTNQYNATAANNSGNELANYMMQAYSMPFGAYNNINSMGLGGASSLAQQNAQNFPVYQSNNLMNLWGLI